MNHLSLATCLQQEIQWEKSQHPEFPYTAKVAGKIWKIRLNDFPAEPLYTLLIDEHPIGDFDDWSPVWRK